MSGLPTQEPEDTSVVPTLHPVGSLISEAHGGAGAAPAQHEPSAGDGDRSPEDRTAALAHIAEIAQKLHPGLGLARERFAAFLARHLPASGEELRAFEEEHIGDLYLAWAYGLGERSARERIEREHFDRIERRLRRMSASPAIIAEILQELRCRLVELHDPEAAGRGYVGRGSLGGWLFVAAVRIAERRSERDRHEIPGHEPALVSQDRLAQALDPEMDHLVHSYKSTFESAIREALHDLSSRERNLLRYHFLEKLSIDRLAELYGVHRATAARWIVRAQRRLAENTRARFAAQIPTAAQSMPRLLALIRSKLDLGLSAVLQRAAEPEDPES